MPPFARIKSSNERPFVSWVAIFVFVYLIVLIIVKEIEFRETNDYNHDSDYLLSDGSLSQ